MIQNDKKQYKMIQKRYKNDTKRYKTIQNDTKTIQNNTKTIQNDTKKNVLYRSFSDGFHFFQIKDIASVQ